MGWCWFALRAESESKKGEARLDNVRSVEAGCMNRSRTISATMGLKWYRAMAHASASSWRTMRL